MDAKEKGKIRRSNALEKQGNTKKKMEEQHGREGRQKAVIPEELKNKNNRKKEKHGRGR